MEIKSNHRLPYEAPDVKPLFRIDSLSILESFSLELDFADFDEEDEL